MSKFGSFVDTVQSDEHFKDVCERWAATDEMVADATHLAYELFISDRNVLDVIAYARALERMAAPEPVIVRICSILTDRYPETQLNSLCTRTVQETIACASKHLVASRTLQLAVDLLMLYRHTESAKTQAG